MSVFSEIDFEVFGLDIDAAATALERRGLIIVRGAIRQQLMSALYERLLIDAHEVEARDPDQFWNIREDILGSPGHIGILPAFTGTVINKDILAPQGVFEVMQLYLGPDLYIHEWVDNINHAHNASEQNAHRDKEVDDQGRSCGLILNAAVQPTSAANGMTCFWLDSHRADFDQNDDPTGGTLPFPQYRPVLATGDVIVRDLALLHKGVANPHDIDRHLAAIVFNPACQPMDPRFVRGVRSEAGEDIVEEVALLLRHHRAAHEAALAPCAYPIPEVADG